MANYYKAVSPSGQIDVFEDVGGTPRAVALPEFQQLGLNVDHLPSRSHPTFKAPNDISGVLKRGNDIFVQQAGQERKIELPEFKNLGINADFLQEGKAVPLDQARKGPGPAPAGDTEPDLSKMIENAAASGLSPDQISKILEGQFKPKTVDQIYTELEERFGIDTNAISEAFSKKPKKSFEVLYKDLYASEGLDKIQTKISELTNELQLIDKEFNDTQGKINSNPWLAQPLRNAYTEKERNEFNARRKTVVDLLTLYTGQYERARDDIREMARTVLEEANDERTFARQELDFLADRVEKELNAQQDLAQSKSRELLFKYAPSLVTGTRRANASGGGGTVSERNRALVARGISKARARLEASRGTDGYVDPKIYNQLRLDFATPAKDWEGADVAEFDDAFANLLSPQERARLGVGKATSVPAYKATVAEIIQQYRDAGFSEDEINKIFNIK